MKTEHCPQGIRTAQLLVTILALGGSICPSAAQTERLAITAIQLDTTNAIVTARVPSGLRRVTLESRERLGEGNWEPRAVARLDGSGGVISFRLPHSRLLELMRVRGDTNEPLPASFYSGTNSFVGQASSSGGLETTGPTDTRTGSPTGTAGREVVESDIWMIRGPTLYFFNQLRGLQLVDITNPDAAIVRGTLELPAAGEQMYLLGTSHVVLLARDGCSYDTGEESQVLIVADTNGPPTVVARLPVAGFIQESRLVGSVLYLASQTYRPIAGSDNTSWEWGTWVSAFDLSNPNAPASRGTLWYAGYGNVVAATDTYLFVVTQDPTNWWQSFVRVIDITAPDGTMRAYGSVRTAGRVPDKFKLDYTGAVFTSISEDWHWDGGQRLVTKLETFHLPDPRSAGPVGIVKLGELELGRGERLHATRFDSNRVYVVTFFQIDPLWVVDLADPVRPRITGQVEVPGWSTYIQPLGDRLVTVGVESNRVAVSLFDVADPAAPGLLSRVLLGQNFSWSEANYDEKAFTVLPDAGLILVPYNGDTTNGYASRVQLIDLNRSSLAVRGAIEHDFQPRRATLYTNRILSISGWELLSVDATDRDHPQVRGETELAWSVDRLFLHGNYLVELAASTWWGNQNRPTLRVAPAAMPNQIVNRLSLTNLPVLGAASRDGRLYLAQGTVGWFYPLEYDSGTSGSNSTFLLTIISLDRLPDLQIVGQTEATVQSRNLGADLQALWPRPGLLVWAGGGFNFWWGREMGGPSDSRMASSSPAFRPWPWWGGGGGQFVAFDVSAPAAAQFASELDLASSNWWSFSKAFTAEGLVYVSHQTSEFVPGLASPNQTTGEPTITTNDSTGQTITNNGPSGTWVMRSYLDAVDYADARNPLVRKPVNIPSTLHGISHRGSLLYTVGPHWTTNWSDWTEYLEASAYDGVSAHLVDSLALPDAWPHPVLVVQTNIFIGRPGYNYTNTNTTAHYVETWALSGAGRFTQLGRVSLPMPANMLANFPGLLAVQETDNLVALFDSGNPVALRQIGQSPAPGCLGFDLSHADGEAARGLWIPLGDYGVEMIPISP